MPPPTPSLPRKPPFLPLSLFLRLDPFLLRLAVTLPLLPKPLLSWLPSSSSSDHVNLKRAAAEERTQREREVGKGVEQEEVAEKRGREGGVAKETERGGGKDRLSIFQSSSPPSPRRNRSFACIHFKRGEEEARPPFSPPYL